MSKIMRKYQQGQSAYLVGKPRPRYDEKKGRPTSSGMKHLGWMIARSRDVMKIIDELRTAGADCTRDYDVVLSRRVRELDRKHGLAPLPFQIV